MATLTKITKNAIVIESASLDPDEEDEFGPEEGELKDDGPPKFEEPERLGEPPDDGLEPELGELKL